MNDFTKEELIKIYNFIERNKQDSYDDMQFKIIEDKLQSMIDNYCEIKTPTMASYCCKKCNEEWHQCECKETK